MSPVGVIYSSALNSLDFLCHQIHAVAALGHMKVGHIWEALFPHPSRHEVGLKPVSDHPQYA